MLEHKTINGQHKIKCHNPNVNNNK